MSKTVENMSVILDEIKKEVDSKGGNSKKVKTLINAYENMISYGVLHLNLKSKELNLSLYKELFSQMKSLEELKHNIENNLIPQYLKNNMSIEVNNYSITVGKISRLVERLGELNLNRLISLLEAKDEFTKTITIAYNKGVPLIIGNKENIVPIRSLAKDLGLNISIITYRDLKMLPQFKGIKSILASTELSETEIENLREKYTVLNVFSCK